MGWRKPITKYQLVLDNVRSRMNKSLNWNLLSVIKIRDRFLIHCSEDVQPAESISVSPVTTVSVLFSESWRPDEKGDIFVSFHVHFFFPEGFVDSNQVEDEVLDYGFGGCGPIDNERYNKKIMDSLCTCIWRKKKFFFFFYCITHCCVTHIHSHVYRNIVFTSVYYHKSLNEKSVI